MARLIALLAQPLNNGEILIGKVDVSMARNNVEARALGNRPTFVFATQEPSAQRTVGDNRDLFFATQR
jgi:hypothetical protein